MGLSLLFQIELLQKVVFDFII